MSIQTRTLLTLILLGIVDALIPIPILGLVLIYVVLQKPTWFAELAREIYNVR